MLEMWIVMFAHRVVNHVTWVSFELSTWIENEPCSKDHAGLNTGAKYSKSVDIS